MALALPYLFLRVITMWCFGRNHTDKTARPQDCYTIIIDTLCAQTVNLFQGHIRSRS